MSGFPPSALYLEGVQRPQALAEAVRRAQLAGKPVVVIKTGRSEMGAAQAQSHTAALCGSDAVTDAYFERIGAPRVTNLASFIEALKLLHIHGPLKNGSYVTLSCSGGEATLIADAAEGHSAKLHSFTSGEIAKIGATTHPLVQICNPFDYHTFDWLKPQRLKATFEEVMKSGQELSILLIDIPHDDRCPTNEWLDVIEAWKSAATEIGAKTAVLSTLPEGMPEQIADDLMAFGTVPLIGIEDALAAIDAAKWLGHFEPCLPLVALDKTPAAGEARWFDENQAKGLLGASGVDIPKGRLVSKGIEAVTYAETLGGPVVLKAVDRSLLHKSEKNAVRLNLSDPALIEQAMSELQKIAPQIRIEEMVTGGIAELIIGIRRDPAIGLYMVLGSGGIFVELIADQQVVLLPFDRSHVLNALKRVRIWPLLQGFRGQPKAAIERLIDTIMAIQDFALEHADRLSELEINPLIVTSEQAVAADALLCMIEREPI